MIKLVVFDLDGVLLETRNMHYEALNAALKYVGDEFVISPEDHLKKFNGLPTATKLEMLTKERGLDQKFYNQIKLDKQNHTIEWILENVKEDERLSHIFQCLSASGVHVCVASNSVRYTVKLALKKLNLINWVNDSQNFYLSNEDVRYPKPNPQIYLMCMAKCGIGPHETLIIEDSPVGLMAAKLSGANVLKVNSPEETANAGIIQYVRDGDPL